MISLNHHPAFRELCSTLRDLQSHGSVTVDEALDALDTIVHNATRTSQELHSLYPKETSARLARILRANRESKAGEHGNGPEAA